MTRWSQAYQQLLIDRLYPGQMRLDADADGGTGAFCADSHLSGSPSKDVLVPDQTLLDQVRQTHEEAVASRAAFVAAVQAAHDAGFANTRIAAMASLSEAGVRALLKRAKHQR